MEKALEILTGLRQAKSYDENYPTDYEIQEAIEELKAKNERIKELEEAMQPKTCDGCNNLEDIGKSYKYCKELCINISHSTEMTFYCIRYEPKDNS